MPFDLTLYHTTADHQRQWLGAFAKGLKRCGVRFEMRLAGTGYRPADAGVFWGVRAQHLIKQCGNYVVLERGYFGDRTKHTAVGLNGLNNRADFCNQVMPGDRWQQHGVAMQPWNPVGDYVLLVGQVEGDMSTAHLHLSEFYKQAVKDIKAFIDLPIIFRPHPLSRRDMRIDGAKTSTRSLGDDLNGAAFVVTCNSNTGVDAMLAGKPVVIYDPGSMVTGLAAESVDELSLFEPDRQQWAYDLAYAQWTQSEIEAGDAWQHIKPRLFELCQTDTDTGAQ